MRAQLSVGVVDEAVYGVKPDDDPRPAAVLLPARVQPRRHRVLARLLVRRLLGHASSCCSRSGAARSTLADFKGDRPAQPQVRKDFPDAIFWAGNLVTDADGTATVQLAYPDALTTWRLTARAVTPDTLVGTTVARTTTTKDLILRVVTPRFLTEGDKVDRADHRAQLPARGTRRSTSR